MRGFKKLYLRSNYNVIPTLKKKKTMAILNIIKAENENNEFGKSLRETLQRSIKKYEYH